MHNNNDDDNNNNSNINNKLKALIHSFFLTNEQNVYRTPMCHVIYPTQF